MNYNVCLVLPVCSIKNACHMKFRCTVQMLCMHIYWFYMNVWYHHWSCERNTEPQTVRYEYPVFENSVQQHNITTFNHIRHTIQIMLYQILQIFILIPPRFDLLLKAIYLYWSRLMALFLCPKMYFQILWQLVKLYTNKYQYLPSIGIQW